MLEKTPQTKINNYNCNVRKREIGGRKRQSRYVFPLKGYTIVYIIIIQLLTREPCIFINVFDSALGEFLTWF